MGRCRLPACTQGRPNDHQRCRSLLRKIVEQTATENAQRLPSDGAHRSDPEKNLRRRRKVADSLTHGLTADGGWMSRWKTMAVMLIVIAAATIVTFRWVNQ